MSPSALKNKDDILIGTLNHIIRRITVMNGPNIHTVTLSNFSGMYISKSSLRNKIRLSQFSGEVQPICFHFYENIQKEIQIEYFFIHLLGYFRNKKTF